MSPDLVTLVRDAQAKREGLVATIAAAQGELADLDREFAEVRQALGLPLETRAESDGIEKVCQLCRKPFISRSSRQKMCRTCTNEQPHVSVDQIQAAAVGEMRVCQNPTCPRQGAPFKPRPLTTGQWCSRGCYAGGKRRAAAANREKPGEKAGENGRSPEEAPRLEVPADAPLPKRRCATCLVSFQPTQPREFVCPGCVNKPKETARVSAPVADNTVQGRDLTIVRNLANGPRTEGQLLQVLAGATKEDLQRALRRLELRGRIARSGEQWRTA